MTGDRARLLYLARHAEPRPDGGGLTERGERQAELLGRRLAGLPVDRVTHGPLPRARETARVVASQFASPPALDELALAGDYVPHVPGRDELPEAWADTVLPLFSDTSAEEAAQGARLGSEALERLAGPAIDGRPPVEVVVTHAFTIGWLVRAALDAPGWRWWPPSHCHAGLTAIRYTVDGPPVVLTMNDVAHLVEELKWTGFPAELRV